MLFGGEKPQINPASFGEILKEAESQTVFTTVFSCLEKSLIKYSPLEYEKYSEVFFSKVITNTQNFTEHGELHRIMSQNGIPYSVIKGIASAYYYPEASLRDMGDVDFLVYEKDFEKSKQTVTRAGFEIDHGDDDDGIHIAFSRKPLSVWEQHRSVNGIPGGRVGELIKKEISRTVETSELITLDGVSCKIPDAFHHGLIMLLHVASHMTHEGVGLRHLCDWAVFADRIDNNEFTRLFESKLKSFGLWKFAQILTLLSEKYLGIAHKSWSESNIITEEQLADIMEDILSGGNFGKKDMNRYREIKYISNPEERTVDDKNVASQAIKTLNNKVCRDYKWIKKHKVFLPVGWVAEGVKYTGILIKGERKTKGTSAMLKEAAKRKNIYSQMNLFETE